MGTQGLRAAALMVIALALAAGCTGGGGKGPARTVDVGQLTIEDVRERALAALSRPDMVFHTVQTAHVEQYDFRQEVWLDLERGLARSEDYVDDVLQEDGGVRIYHDDRVAAVFDGRFADAPITPGAGSAPLPTSALALDYTGTLHAEQDVTSVELKEAAVDGTAAILVEIVLPAGDGAGDETDRIFLSEQFLPLKVERRGPGGDGTLLFQNEFLARSSLPAELFSIEAVRAFEKTGADRMQEAVDAGFHPYWLGEQYLDLPLYDTDIIAGDDGQTLHVSYEANALGPDAPYGLNIIEYDPEDWRERLDRFGQQEWWQEASVVRIPVTVPDATATVYQATGNLALVVGFDEVVLFVDANIGPSNPYRTVEALSEVALALRPFEAEPGSPGGFRAFAAELQTALANRDTTFLDGRVKLTTGICTEADVEGGIGAAPCTAVGEPWAAFLVGYWRSEGGYNPDFSGSGYLSEIYDTARPELSDAFGDGSARLYALSLSDTRPGTIITSLRERPADFAGSGPLRLVYVLLWTYEEDRWQATSSLYAAVLSEDFLIPCQAGLDYLGGAWERFPDPSASGGPGPDACP